MNRIHFDMKKHHDNNCDRSTTRMTNLYESCKHKRPAQDDVNQPIKKKVARMDDTLGPTGTPDHQARAVSVTNISSSAGRKSDKTIILHDDLIAYVASFLNVGSLTTARLVCKRFNHILSRNSAGWPEHCHRLWNKRAHVSVKAQELLNKAVLRREHEACETTPTPTTTNKDVASDTAAMEAYRQSCFDARLRHVIRPEELVYDPSRTRSSSSSSSSSIKGSRFDTIWSFRFKESAGREWTRYDPWHNGKGPARRMVFLPDGRVAQIVGNADENHEMDGCHGETLNLCRPFSDDDDENNNDEDNESDVEDDGGDRASRGMDIQWRIIRQPVDLPPQKEGGNDVAAYIRLTVGGRDVPTYIVNRSPTGNWGFLMENCWGVFASFPLPSKRKDTASSTDNAERTRAPSGNAAAAPDLQPPVPQPQPFASSQMEGSASSTFSAVGGESMLHSSILQLSVGSDSNNYADAVNDEEDEDDLFLWFGEDLFDEDMESVAGSFNGEGDGRRDSDRDSPLGVSLLPRLSQDLTTNMSRSASDLLEDASLAVSNHWQWREALLYNLGMTSRLPDGPNALAEWSQAMWRGMSMRTATTIVAPHYTYHYQNQQQQQQHDYYWSDDDDFEDDEIDHFPIEYTYSHYNGAH